MADPRILYFCWDNPEPSGGVKAIYDHVRHLVRNGFSAFVVHAASGFKPGWFQDDVPTLHYGQGLSLQPDDVAIVPEGHARVLELLKPVPVRKMIFCQNHHFVFDGLDRNSSWQDLGITRVFASSDVIARFLQSELGWRDVPVVHYAVDRDRFKPLPKRMQVACMPRKRQKEAEFIGRLADHLLAGSANLQWLPLDGVSESAVAQALGESAIFLSLGRFEGFGLPPLEAMACGCAVVGFHGQGGLEYATADNGFWCADDDLVACARSLVHAVRLWQKPGLELARILQGGAHTAARYTWERQEAELLGLMRGIVRGS